MRNKQETIVPTGFKKNLSPWSDSPLTNKEAAVTRLEQINITQPHHQGISSFTGNTTTVEEWYREHGLLEARR